MAARRWASSSFHLSRSFACCSSSAFVRAWCRSTTISFISSRMLVASRFATAYNK
jgi:hypothetical protein